MKYKLTNEFLEKLVDNPQEVGKRNLCLMSIDAIKDKKAHELFQTTFADSCVGQDLTTSKMLYLVEDGGEGAYKDSTVYANRAVSLKWQEIRDKIQQEVAELKSDKKQLTHQILNEKRELNVVKDKIRTEQDNFDKAAVAMSQLSEKIEGLGLIARLKICWALICKRFEDIDKSWNDEANFC